MIEVLTFFAFLDLDHLEAKKKNKWNDEKDTLARLPRMMKIPSNLIFFFWAFPKSSGVKDQQSFLLNIEDFM